MYTRLRQIVDDVYNLGCTARFSENSAIWRAGYDTGGYGSSCDEEVILQVEKGGTWSFILGPLMVTSWHRALMLFLRTAK